MADNKYSSFDLFVSKVDLASRPISCCTASQNSYMMWRYVRLSY